MGIFNSLMHGSIKKQIKRQTNYYSSLDSDLKSVLIFQLWITRGINLSAVNGNPNINIPIYYYVKGAEAILPTLINLYEKHGNKLQMMAANHHYLTNFANSYPEKGYPALVKDLWGALYLHHDPISSIYHLIEDQLKHNNSKAMIENNDVSFDEFLDNDKSIYPHFMVPGHPLTIELIEKQKRGDYIL